MLCLSQWTPTIWKCTEYVFPSWASMISLFYVCDLFGWSDCLICHLWWHFLFLKNVFLLVPADLNDLESNCLMWPLWFDHVTSSVVCASNPSRSHFNPRSLWSEKMLRWQHRPTSIHFSRRKTFCINFPILHFFLIFLLADSELAECCIIEVVDHRCGEAVNLAAVTLWSWTH